jgi:hypothetical protein
MSGGIQTQHCRIGLRHRDVIAASTVRSGDRGDPASVDREERAILPYPPTLAPAMPIPPRQFRSSFPLLLGLLSAACGSDEPTYPLVCGASAQAAVMVTVIDSVTGGQPANVIVVVRQAGEVVDSAGPQVRGTDIITGKLVVPGGMGRLGRLDVSVRASGYHDWTTSVDVGSEGCLTLTHHLTARLQKPAGP